MPDTNTLKLTFDKPQYAVGEKMTLTLSGSFTRTSDVTLSNLSASVTLSDGSRVNLTVPATIVKDGQVTNLTARLTGITDPSGRVWAVAADGLSAWSVA